MKHCIRVLLAEDSPTVYQFLQQTLESASDIRLIGWAKDGREAVQQTARLKPDLVLMDLHMPVMNGLQATREIMSSTPTPILMITATGNPDDVTLSLDTLRSGALAIIEKPVGLLNPANDKQAANLLNLVRALAEVKTVKLHPQRRAAKKVENSAQIHCKVLALAASTGGPQALSYILAGLTADFPVPILLVQHISADFSEGFTHWLQAGTGMVVAKARQGEAALPGHLYVAGPEGHLGIEPSGRVIVSDTPAIAGFRPSASYLFESAARAFGSRATGIVLTGMGEDGIQGLKVLSQLGGYVIAQDQDSSIVYGMPKAAVEAKIVNEVLSLSQIAAWLLTMQQKQFS